MSANYAHYSRKQCNYNRRLFCKNPDDCPLEDREFTDIIEAYILMPRFHSLTLSSLKNSSISSREDYLLTLSEVSSWFDDLSMLDKYAELMDFGKIKITRLICAKWKAAYLIYQDWNKRKEYKTKTEYRKTEEAEQSLKKIKRTLHSIKQIQKTQEPFSRLNSAIATSIRQSLKNNKTGRHWEDLVGFKLSDLREHLQSLFVKGMNWDNYGAWHIDHILPVSSFSFSSIEHPGFKKCWRLKNLQPLWAAVNIGKHNKMPDEYIAYLKRKIG